MRAVDADATVVRIAIAGKPQVEPFMVKANSLGLIACTAADAVVTGSIQSMSRAVIQGGGRALRRGLLLHAALGVTLGGSLALGADALGAGVLHDSRLPGLLRLGAIVVADYSVYAALVGAFNGRHRFATQAGLDITFSTMRTGLLIAFASTSMRVTGAMTGFAIASAVIVAVAFFAAVVFVGRLLRVGVGMGGTLARSVPRAQARRAPRASDPLRQERVQPLRPREADAGGGGLGLRGDPRHAPAPPRRQRQGHHPAGIPSARLSPRRRRASPSPPRR
jgi:hypothetical protein